MKREVETKFYEFDQNNSGGWFDIDDERGIGPKLWIEAYDVNDAISRAENLGLYWDGVQDDRDCECCGDRWYKPWREDGKSAPTYDKKYDFMWHDTVYVHYFNGDIKRVKVENV